jgi:hypothetical protein
MPIFVFSGCFRCWRQVRTKLGDRVDRMCGHGPLLLVSGLTRKDAGLADVLHPDISMSVVLHATRRRQASLIAWQTLESLARGAG